MTIEERQCNDGDFPSRIEMALRRRIFVPYDFLILIASGIFAVSGCVDFHHRSRQQSTQSAPLGTISDGVWFSQEQGGEASEFVMYGHEFGLRSDRLTLDGEDHIKQIANRLLNGSDSPVVVERSMNNNSFGRFKYPVNPDPELDNLRRGIVVAALEELGVADAEDLVVVAPAFATPANGQEAESAFYRSLGGGFSGNSFGGGFGGFGGGGIVGGGSSGGAGGGFVGTGSSGSSSDVSSVP